MLEIISIAFVGALVSLDRTAFLQVMVSQPLIAGTLIGWLFGDPFTGLIIGGVIELLWIGSVPVGSSIPPNETVASIIAVSTCMITARSLQGAMAPSIPLMSLSIFTSVPLAIIGQRVDIEVRRYNRRFAINADKLLLSGDPYAIGRENLKGLLAFFVSSFLSLMVLTGVGSLITATVYPFLPQAVLRGFGLSFYLLIALGIAVSMKTAKGTRWLPVLTAGFLTGTLFIYLKD